ncbi:hypothetical protein EVG20_g5008 [Dentipellis fragilis]|uniref:Uncharacterized protein n=1 Tax=Dentipellis fragilis TaxID=205917 RepID=A0A4Y9YWQ1_9AGAM|nr:hypothetical protein EVG20_g5008 [Dentipellis fragilis]
MFRDLAMLQHVAYRDKPRIVPGPDHAGAGALDIGGSAPSLYPPPPSSSHTLPPSRAELTNRDTQTVVRQDLRVLVSPDHGYTRLEAGTSEAR